MTTHLAPRVAHAVSGGSAAATYTRAALVQALRAIGLDAGDAVFFHVSAVELGTLLPERTHDGQAAELLGALQEVLGPSGTLLVPSYSFAFCRHEPFDVESTPSMPGPWSRSGELLELVRRHPAAVRSRDPIHAIAGIGPLAHALLDDVPPTCFGPGCVHERLLQAGGKVCTIGVGLHEAAFRHYVEQAVGVPFRYRKLFTGRLRESGSERQIGWIYDVRLLADAAFPDGARLEARVLSDAAASRARVGAGEVQAIACSAFRDAIERLLTEDPWATARGPAGDPVALEAARVGVSSPALTPAATLPPDASMWQMLEALWPLRRDLISDGYDAALAALGTQLPLQVHAFPSGTECWSWIVPEKWTCHEAYVATLDGRRLFGDADHPLHVVSYSLPFEGVVSREALLAHLHVHPLLEDAVPFVFAYYERTWGLCCSRRQRDALTDSHYRVVIRTSDSYGTLKVGEVVLRGESDETIVLCAHLCHPHMVNDDLAGVVVGIDVMRALQRRPRRRYTYRLLIVPETIGSVAWLSRHAALLPRLRGGLFLEMLGLDAPHALQHSFAGDTALDRTFARVLHATDDDAWTGAFRTVIGNDERQFNAPGVRVPMLSLSRVRRPSDPAWPYPEYHSSHDTLTITSSARLHASRDLVLAMLDAAERDVVPVPRNPGELFCSRYGVHVDAYADPAGHRALFDILYLIDGTHAVSDIAAALDVPFDTVSAVVDRLCALDLVTVAPPSGRAGGIA